MQATRLAQSVQCLGYKLKDRGIVGEFLVGARRFSVVQSVQHGREKKWPGRDRGGLFFS
jgi:hypothetical protein